MPNLGQAFYLWLKIGLLSFGGPAAQIALMHQMIVEEKKWLDETQFLGALNFCMLLPGPEAMQIATYIGWRMHGLLGGLIAGLLFVLPGALIIAALAVGYAYWGNLPLITALFSGVKAAVIVIIIQAMRRIFTKTLDQKIYWVICIFSFLAIFFLRIPFPIIILTSALLSAMISFYRKQVNNSPVSSQIKKTSPDVSSLSKISWHPLIQSLKTVFLWLSIWWIPLFMIKLLDLYDGLMWQIGVFFSKIAVITFGGAYAVLSYLTHNIVNHFGWLETNEVIDSLGLAETTPGPLILVNQFVAFIAAFKHAGLGAAFMASVIALWATFVPCFLWIFTGAPYIHWILEKPFLYKMLKAISASIVAVLLNLSLCDRPPSKGDHLVYLQ
ncbi:MAG: chromate efflux transporter [Pseudomonadota bacterium]